MAKKTIEKHITVLEPTHNKLKQLAKTQRRSMRQCVSKLIDEEIERRKLKKEINENNT